MKLLIVISFISCFLGGNTQSVKNFYWWNSKGLLDSFPQHLSVLQGHLDQLNQQTLAPLKKSLDNWQVQSDSEELYDSIKSSYKPNIESSIKRIESSNFFYRGGTDTSFLFYYTNKELNDYLSSLESFGNAASSLIYKEDGICKIKEFSETNFLNAYYHVAMCRSLLLAAMSNLQNYLLLATDNDSIKTSTIDVNNRIIKVDTVVSTVSFRISEINESTMHTKKSLSDSFEPYFKMKSHKSLLKANNNNTDKISTSANTILAESRRNWWWRSLIGGVIGGLIAGLTVSIIN